MFDARPPIAAAPLRPFPQTDAYAAAAAACGARSFRADLGCGTALVLQRPGLRLVSRGPVWEPGTAEAAKRRALCRLARFPGLLIATPDEPLAGPGLLPLVTGLHVAEWDLAGDLRPGMAGKWRNRLSAAERAGLRLTRGTPATLSRLVALADAQARARRYRGHPAAFSLALPPEQLRLWEWRQGGQMAAAMAFVTEGQGAWWHLSWAAPEAKVRHVPTLMLAHAARALQAEGIRQLDLGTVNGEAAPGLLRFKLGTGARLRRLGATMLVLPR